LPPISSNNNFDIVCYIHILFYFECPQNLSYICPPENRDKNLDKSESERTKSAPTPTRQGKGINFYGRYGNVRLTDQELEKADKERKERDTPYVLETVCLIIDERYKSGKPFIITTNLSLQELQNPADLEHGRIYDRIMERYTLVAFCQELPHRQGQSKQGKCFGHFKGIEKCFPK